MVRGVGNQGVGVCVCVGGGGMAGGGEVMKGVG